MALMHTWKRGGNRVRKLTDSRCDHVDNNVFDPAILLPVNTKMLQSRYLTGSIGLLPTSPVVPLADPYFAPWERLSQLLATLNRQKGSLRTMVSELAILDASKLSSRNDLQRAYVLLGQLMHSWVNGHNVLWPNQDREDNVDIVTHMYKDFEYTGSY